MSYTPDNQRFEQPIDKILEGIKEFDEVVDKRIEANKDSYEWKKDHIEEISEISLELRQIKRKLQKLQSETR